jgi:hypothetical protein
MKGWMNCRLRETNGSEWLVATTLITGTKVRDFFPLVTQPVFATIENAPKRSLSDKAFGRRCILNAFMVNTSEKSRKCFTRLKQLTPMPLNNSPMPKFLWIIPERATLFNPV